MTEIKGKYKKDGTKDLGGRRHLGDVPQNEMFGLSVHQAQKRCGSHTRII